MSNVTLATLGDHSNSDILSSEEFLAYRRRDAPGWSFEGHVARCESCQADLIALHLENFRTFLSDQGPALPALGERIPDVSLLPIGSVIGTDPNERSYIRQEESLGRRPWVLLGSTGEPVDSHRGYGHDGFLPNNWYLTGLPESTATPEHTPTEQVEVPSETVAAPPARYSHHQGVFTMRDGDRADYGVLDAERHEVAPWLGENYAESLNAGRTRRSDVSWSGLEPGFRFPDGYVVPEPRLEESGFETWQFAMAHFIYAYVYDQGNVSYYNTLANKGLLPTRHEVRAWRNSLTEGGEVNEWLVALGEQALESEMCEVYDRMCEGLKLPTREELGIEREKDYTVDGYATITIRVPVTTTVRASNEDDALRIAEDNDDISEHIDRYTIQDAIGNGNWDYETGEWEEASDRS